ncbi:MAG: DUF5615 family PIN-like protein [Armatimonadota bacterium]
MILWLDAHLSPALATGLETALGCKVVPIRDLGLRESSDLEIFASAKLNESIILTKDSDFAELVQRFGPPPSIIWIRSGNRSNSEMLQVLTRILPLALLQIESGESLVEIR